MQEPGNDRLEEFFRKAVSRPDVPFDEADWRKLEEKLDALDTATPPAPPRARNGIVAGAAVLLLAVMMWTGLQPGEPETDVEAIEMESQAQLSPNDPNPADDIMMPPPSDVAPPMKEEARGLEETTRQPERSGEIKTNTGRANTNRDEVSSSQERAPQGGRTQERVPPSTAESRDVSENDVETRSGQDDHARSRIADEMKTTPELLDRPPGADRNASISFETNTTELAHSGEDEIRNVGYGKIYSDLIGPAVNGAERNKQKAIVRLPGAGEGDNAVAQAMVTMEEPSRDEASPTVPRLSLLLTFAPDFSGTGFNYKSAPGRSFGALAEYRVFPRFSIYAGALVNFKQYTGDGEDYSPPKGYWKYYTNGIVPTTIDGSCRVVEFPLAVRYAIASNANYRITMSAGSSSYMMRDESYRYHFAEPNPGARSGWNSSGTSRFFFNMLNFTVAYERELLPGIAIGLEPYIKIPLEGIGWSDIKLYSTGLSITARYNVMKRRSSRTARPPN